MRGHVERLALADGWQVVTARVRALALLDEVAEALPWGIQERAVARRRAIWQAIVEHLDPETGVVVTTDEQIAARASILLADLVTKPVSRSSAAAHRVALQQAGVLRLLQSGASGQTLGTDRNRAPSYAITGPGELVGAVEENWNLPEGSAPARTQEIYPPRRPSDFPAAADVPAQVTPSNAVLGRSRQCDAQRAQQPPEKINPQTSSEKLNARAWLAHQLRCGTRRFALTDKELIKVTSPFFAAGWSAQAVLAALVRKPDGSTHDGPLPTLDQRDHPSQPQIHNLWAVMTWRLSHWRDPMSLPLHPPVPAWRAKRGRPRKNTITEASAPTAMTRTRAPSEAKATIEATLTAAAVRKVARQVEPAGHDASSSRQWWSSTAVADPWLPSTSHSDREPPAVARDERRQVLIRQRALLRAHAERHNRKADGGVGSAT